MGVQFTVLLALVYLIFFGNGVGAFWEDDIDYCVSVTIVLIQA